MKMKILKYYPHNKNKVFEQTFEQVKIRACSYVYFENDRIKKICSTIDKRINNIQISEITKEDNLNIYEIILIDPTAQQTIQIKKELIDKGKEDFLKRIQQYNYQLQLIEKYNNNLNKTEKRLLKKKEKENV